MTDFQVCVTLDGGDDAPDDTITVATANDALGVALVRHLAAATAAGRQVKAAAATIFATSDPTPDPGASGTVTETQTVTTGDGADAGAVLGVVPPAQ